MRRQRPSSRSPATRSPPRPLTGDRRPRVGRHQRGRDYGVAVVVLTGLGPPCVRPRRHAPAPPSTPASAHAHRRAGLPSWSSFPSTTSRRPRRPRPRRCARPEYAGRVEIQLLDDSPEPARRANAALCAERRGLGHAAATCLARHAPASRPAPSPSASRPATRRSRPSSTLTSVRRPTPWRDSWPRYWPTLPSPLCRRDGPIPTRRHVACPSAGGRPRRSFRGRADRP